GSHPDDPGAGGVRRRDGTGGGLVHLEAIAADHRPGLRIRCPDLLAAVQCLVLTDQGDCLRGHHRPGVVLLRLQHAARCGGRGSLDHRRSGEQLGAHPAARPDPRKAAVGAVIRIRDVHKRFGAMVVLDGVTLDVQDGETLALLGPSGTGKSVLLKHIIGLIRPDAGDIDVDGLHVPTLDRDALAKLRRTIGYVFQNGALFDSDNVYENIRLGLTDPNEFGDDAFARERVSECLRLVNLPDSTLAKMPSELSGGMRKRVGIARAIAGRPKYVLYDEPTSGLDPVNSDIIDGLIRRLNDELGVTGIMVTHDVRGAFRTADRIALLTGGKVVAEGTPDEFRASQVPEVRAFLERDFDLAPLETGLLQ